LITDELQVVEALCKGCGICSAICPQDAIVMRRDLRGLYTPEINNLKCLQCMLCARSCPAVPASLARRQEHRHILKTHDEPLLGYCSKSYAGYSTDEDIRHRATSGGIVSALLLDALEHEDVDSVLTVQSDEEDPFKPRAVVSRNKQEILHSRGSKYMPVEFSAALKQIIRDDSIKHIGIVGLPCHIEGIRRASLLIPVLRKKIVLTIGLFCKQTKDLRFTDLVLAKAGVKKEQVRGIKFRGDGWPGYIRIFLKNGDTIRHPYEAFGSLWGTLSCSPVHCLLCSSPMAKAADVSAGDAWLQEYQGDKKGVSLLLVRTEAGAKIVDRAIQDARVHLEAIDQDRILDAQPRFIVMIKKTNSGCRWRVLRLLDRRIPDPNIRQTDRGNSWGYLEALWIIGVRYTASSALYRRIFPLFPSIVLEVLGRGTIEIWKFLCRLGR